ncbi:conjugal transfer protein TraF, partial [Cedecea sp. VD32]
MNKIKSSVATLAATFFIAHQAGAAGTWSEARNDAMGGTGVASANYGSGVLINPALLARSKPDDNITVILPSVGAQITDKDNLQDRIDGISDKVDNYKQSIGSLTLRDILFNPNGTLNQFRSAAGDLAGELEDLR